jgi:hypothetical protein
MATRGTRTAALITAPLALVGLGAAPASAGETERFAYGDCFLASEEEQWTLCFDVEGRIHTTTTKSGNENVVLRVDYSDRLVGPDGEEIASASFSDKVHILHKDGVGQVFTIKSTGTTSFEGETCSFTFHLHESNGEVRVDRWDMTCV